MVHLSKFGKLVVAAVIILLVIIAIVLFSAQKDDPKTDNPQTQSQSESDTPITPEQPKAPDSPQPAPTNVPETPSGQVPQTGPSLYTNVVILLLIVAMSIYFYHYSIYKQHLPLQKPQNQL